MMAAERDNNFIRRGGSRGHFKVFPRGRGYGTKGHHRGQANPHHSSLKTPSFNSLNNTVHEIESDVATIDGVPKNFFTPNPNPDFNSTRKNLNFFVSPDSDGDSNTRPKNRDFSNFVFSPNSTQNHRNLTNHVFSPKSGGDHRYSNNIPKPSNFATSPNSPTPNNTIGPISPGGSSPTSDGHSLSKDLCNDGSWDDLLGFLDDKFSEELELLESLDSEVINTWCHLKEIADEGIKEMDYSAIKGVLLTRRDQLAQKKCSTAAPTSFNRDGTTHDEIEILWQKFESKPVLKSNDEQEIASLKVTIRSLTTQLHKDKENFNAQLDELQKKFEKRIKAINSSHKEEQERNKLSQEKIQKEYEGKVETVRAEYIIKCETLKTDKQKLENQLNNQLQDNEILVNETLALKNQILADKQHTLEDIKEIIKDNCECSICLSIYDKVVITSCGHAFCKKCIEQWRVHVNNNKKCPNCRAVCTFKSIYFFNEMITQLQNKFPSVDWTAKEDAASPLSPR